MGILSLVTFLPLIGAALLMLLPKENTRLAKYTALGVSVVTFLASLGILAQFKFGTYHFQLNEVAEWVPQAGISYRLGVDGISLWLVLLTSLMSVVSVWLSFYVEKRVNAYMAVLLTLETAMIGSFVALDLVLFFTFFELTLIPMWLLVAIWGGEKRHAAANKFIIYTFAGSIFMLVGIVGLASAFKATSGHLSFNILEIQAAVANGHIWTGLVQLETILFWSFAISFLIKSPAFPFHTWIPDTYAEAPMSGPILSSVMVKMGTYGFLRFCLPLFPEVVQSSVPILMTLAVIGIVYGAIVAAVQPDMRRLIAYSSVSHMGFILLGIFSLTHSGLMGGAMQQLNHGISTGAMFLLFGFLYQRRGSGLFKDLGGLKGQMPLFAALFLIVMLSSAGLPGTNGFIGEFLAMLGAFEAGFAHAFGLNLAFAVLAGFGVVLAAVYLLYMFQQVFYGPVKNQLNRRLKDLKPWEVGLVVPLIVLIVWGGLYPSTFLKPMEASLQATRMMASNPPGERPVWDDLSLEIVTEGRIEDRGALAKGQTRTQDELGGAFQMTSIIAPPNLHLAAAERGTTEVLNAPRRAVPYASIFTKTNASAAGPGAAVR